MIGDAAYECIEIGLGHDTATGSGDGKVLRCCIIGDCEWRCANCDGQRAAYAHVDGLASEHDDVIRAIDKVRTIDGQRDDVVFCQIRYVSQRAVGDGNGGGAFSEGDGNIRVGFIEQYAEIVPTLRAGSIVEVDAGVVGGVWIERCAVIEKDIARSAKGVARRQGFGVRKIRLRGQLEGDSADIAIIVAGEPGNIDAGINNCACAELIGEVFLVGDGFQIAGC